MKKQIPWRSTVTKDAFDVHGTLFFGAGVRPVAQICRIKGHRPGTFLVLGGGALALAWALQSHARRPRSLSSGPARGP